MFNYIKEFVVRNPSVLLLLGFVLSVPAAMLGILIGRLTGF